MTSDIIITSNKRKYAELDALRSKRQKLVTGYFKRVDNTDLLGISSDDVFQQLPNSNTLSRSQVTI